MQPDLFGKGGQHLTPSPISGFQCVPAAFPSLAAWAMLKASAMFDWRKRRPFIQRSNSRYGEYTNTRWILTQITVFQASKICAKIFTQVDFNMKCLGIFWQRSYHDVRWGCWKRNLKINNNLLAPHTKHKATDSSPQRNDAQNRFERSQSHFMWVFIRPMHDLSSAR